MVGSTFKDNSASRGGAILVEGVADLRNSTLTANSATEGSGIHNRGLLTLTNVTGSNGGALHKIDIQTGTTVQTFSWNLGSDNEDAHSFSGMGCTPMVTNDHVYFGAFNGKFYCLNKDTLEQVWVTDLRNEDLAHNQPITNIRNGSSLSVVADTGSININTRIDAQDDRSLRRLDHPRALHLEALHARHGPPWRSGYAQMCGTLQQAKSSRARRSAASRCAGVSAAPSSSICCHLPASTGYGAFRARKRVHAWHCTGSAANRPPLQYACASTTCDSRIPPIA